MDIVFAHNHSSTHMAPNYVGEPKTAEFYDFWTRSSTYRC